MMTKLEGFKNWMRAPMSKTCWFVIAIVPWIFVWVLYYTLKACRTRVEKKMKESVNEDIFEEE